MPFVLPTPVATKLPISRFKTVDEESAEDFCLQKRKKAFRYGDKALYRCVTKNKSQGYRYLVARDNSLESLQQNEWHYIRNVLPGLIPPGLDANNRILWLIAHFTQLAIEQEKNKIIQDSKNDSANTNTNNNTNTTTVNSPTLTTQTIQTNAVVSPTVVSPTSQLTNPNMLNPPMPILVSPPGSEVQTVRHLSASSADEDENDKLHSNPLGNKVSPVHHTRYHSGPDMVVLPHKRSISDESDVEENAYIQHPYYSNGNNSIRQPQSNGYIMRPPPALFAYPAEEDEEEEIWHRSHRIMSSPHHPHSHHHHSHHVQHHVQHNNTYSSNRSRYASDAPIPYSIRHNIINNSDSNINSDNTTINNNNIDNSINGKSNQNNNSNFNSSHIPVSSSNSHSHSHSHSHHTNCANTVSTSSSTVTPANCDHSTELRYRGSHQVNNDIVCSANSCSQLSRDYSNEAPPFNNWPVAGSYEQVPSLIRANSPPPSTSTPLNTTPYFSTHMRESISRIPKHIAVGYLLALDVTCYLMYRDPKIFICVIITINICSILAVALWCGAHKKKHGNEDHSSNIIKKDPSYPHSLRSNHDLIIANANTSRVPASPPRPVFSSHGGIALGALPDNDPIDPKYSPGFIPPSHSTASAPGTARFFAADDDDDHRPIKQPLEDIMNAKDDAHVKSSVTQAGEISNDSLSPNSSNTSVADQSSSSATSPPVTQLNGNGTDSDQPGSFSGSSSSGSSDSQDSSSLSSSFSSLSVGGRSGGGGSGGDDGDEKKPHKHGHHGHSHHGHHGHHGRKKSTDSDGEKKNDGQSSSSSSSSSSSPDTKAGDNGKLRVGLSITAASTTDEKEMPPMSWINYDATTFNCRIGPNYSRNKKKAPSLEALYECVAVDLYTSPKKIGNIGRLMQLPGDNRDLGAAKGYLPPTIIVNMQVPGYPVENVLFGKNPEDGVGQSLVFFLCPSKYAIEQCAIKRGEAGMAEYKEDNSVWKATADDPVNHALCLLNRFTQSEAGSDLRNRFKAIARMVNVDSAGLGSTTRTLVNKYNGTPFLIRTCSVFHKGPNYFEIDCDVHRFSYLARAGLGQVRERIKDIVFDFSFVVEGHADSELPEQMLGAIRLAKLSLPDAITFPKEFM